MKWVARILAAAIVCAGGMGSAQAPPKRIALIIGNADYNIDGRIDLSEAGEAAARRSGHLPDLANPINDARDVREELAQLRFDVSNYKENASRIDMIALLDTFGRKVAQAGPDAIVFVYYSGHGMQVEGENFLLPAGAQLQGTDFSQMSASAMQAILSGVGAPMTLVRAQLRPRSGDGVNIIVLDACRNNPWDPTRRGSGGRGRGLADQNWGLGQTIIAFSTEPGNIAYDGDPGDRNSPYTLALKAQLATPNVELFSMFNGVARAVEQRTRTWRDGPQRPWINSVTVPQVCLAGCSSSAKPMIAIGQIRYPGDGAPSIHRALFARELENAIVATGMFEVVPSAYRGRTDSTFDVVVTSVTVDRADIAIIFRVGDQIITRPSIRVMKQGSLTLEKSMASELGLDLAFTAGVIVVRRVVGDVYFLNAGSELGLTQGQVLQSFRLSPRRRESSGIYAWSETATGKLRIVSVRATESVAVVESGDPREKDVVSRELPPICFVRCN